MFGDIRESKGFKDEQAKLFELRLFSRLPNHSIQIKGIVEELDPSRSSMTAQQLLQAIQKHLETGDSKSKVTLDRNPQNTDVLVLHMIHSDGVNAQDSTETLASDGSAVPATYKVPQGMYDQFSGIAVDITEEMSQIQREFNDKIAY